ncbi:MAG: sulfite exporter TauE/SafE family protein [Cyanobacteria bacterium P01_E01_bin.6]
MLLDSPLGLGLLLLFGMLTGTLAGLLGIGGGVLLVPALIVAGAETTVQATATSLIGVFFSATSGSIRNLRSGDLNWRAALGIAVFGVFTAQGGARLGERIPDTWLSLGFAALLIITIYLIRLKKQLTSRKQRQANDAINQSFDDDDSRSIQLEQSRSRDNVLGNEISSHSSPPQHQASAKKKSFLRRLSSIASIGATAGMLSGLFGVGGGVVMVPLQMLILGEEIKAAVRTSLGAIVAIAASGLIEHTRNNNVLWIPGIMLGVGGIIGAQLGTRLLPKLPDQTVNIMFRLLLTSLSVYMIIRAIQG